MKEVIKFLDNICKNNNREWFAEHKNEYLAAKETVEKITQEVIDKLSLTDPNIAGLQAKDCMFRIYRDVRFSKDKSPYKEYFGSFIAPGGRKSINSGYYIHLQKGHFMIGGGVYEVPPEILRKCRDGIYYNSKDFKAILENKVFKKTFGGLEEEWKMKMPPRDFPKDFPDIELLKYKNYALGKGLTEKELLAPDFVEKVVADFKIMTPFNNFFNEAMKF